MTPRTRPLALFTPLVLALLAPPAARPAAPDPPRTEGSDDPLPAGGVARLPHPGAVSAVVVRPDGKTVLTAGADGTIRAWDVAAARQRRRWGATGAHALALSPDGKCLLCGHSDGVPRLWDTRTGRPLRAFRTAPRAAGPFGKYCCPIDAVAFAPDGKTCATVQDGAVELWDARTGRPLRRLGGYSPRLFSVAFSPDGTALAATSGSCGKGGWHPDQALRLWDFSTGRERWLFGGLSVHMPSVAFSPDGSALAVGGRPALHDAETGRVRWECPRRGRWGPSVGPVAFAPDGGTLAGGDWAGTAYAWEAATGEVVCRFAGHRRRVSAVAFFPDGRTLATAGADGLVLLWDLTFGLCPAGGRAHRPRAPREAWEDLASARAPRAHRAAWELVAAGGKAVRLLRERLRPTPVAEGERLRGLLARLDDEDFAVREKATREVARLGVEAGPALREALRDKPSLEAHHRMKRLLARAATGRWPPEALRKVRAVRVLGQVGTPEAVALLRSLARGVPASLVSEEATATLRRLEGRAGTGGGGAAKRP